ncbi:MAG: DNA polymerase III subunit beta [Alicyclobacillus sp.]|nr:DNA polymerase III subunit beta [Alicyclobacillus sp.]
MRFTITQPVLQTVIQIAAKAVAVRTPKQVLTGILLETDTQHLTVTAYNLELGIRNEIQATEDNRLSIAEPGAIVLPARYLTEVVRRLPQVDITVAVENHYMTMIQAGSSEFRLHGIDAAEFPNLPEITGGTSLTMPASTLKDLVRSTAFACATSEVRPILTGIYAECNQEALTFTATDGLRLARKTWSLQSANETPWTAVLPSKSLTELAKSLPEEEGAVQVQVTSSHSLFQAGHIQFYTRLIDGAYPDTSKILPIHHKTEVIADSQVFTDALERAALIARDRENHMVRLEVQGTNIHLFSSSPEVGHVSERLTAKQTTGDDLSIAFNARFVLEALRAIGGEQIRLSFNGSNQPFTLRQVGDEDGLQLISPVLWR